MTGINKATQHLIKAALTHGPCLLFAVGGGILFPNLLPVGLAHNMFIEAPLTLAGAAMGEVVGHMLFNKGKTISQHFAALAKPKNLVRVGAYAMISLALHMLVFNAAHFHGGELHFFEHGHGPNFAPHLPWGEGQSLTPNI